MHQVLDKLANAYPTLSTQLRQAAKFVLDHPNEVAINSMRKLAKAADVAPSTMLRLAKALDFKNYEGFRQPFRDAARNHESGFGDRARGLQESSAGGGSEQLQSAMASANIINIEAAFQENTPAIFEQAAKIIRDAEKVYVLGVGGGHALALYFHYVGKMALKRLRLPAGQAGSLHDDLIDITAKDAALAITVEPYSSVTVHAVDFIRTKGAKLVSVTDSRASPLVPGADALLLTQTASPQFFPSYTAATAVLETLLAFIVSGATADTVKNIADIEKLRHDSGIYWNENSS
jgi:DNA-binding MurR/RpiR family transcriptional regulator